MTAHDTSYLAFGLGFATGLATVLALVYLPVRSWARASAQNRRDIARIMRPFRPGGTSYIPVYPGNSGSIDDPDPAWVAWLAEGGVDYRTQRRPARLAPRTTVVLVLTTLAWHFGRWTWPAIADRHISHAWAWLVTYPTAPAPVHRPKRQYRWTG